ncbi:hypothetical protein GCM10009060_00240 [Halorubrum trapanicum]
MLAHSLQPTTAYIRPDSPAPNLNPRLRDATATSNTANDAVARADERPKGASRTREGVAGASGASDEAGEA